MVESLNRGPEEQESREMTFESDGGYGEIAGAFV
jgi:hypothetical protein